MVNRIRQLLEWQQLSPTQFADLIGVGRPVVSHILSERNKPSLEVVQRISEALPAISLTWLLKGTGSMLNGTGASPVTAGPAAPAAAPVQSVGAAPAVATQPPVAAPLPPPATTPAAAYTRPKPDEVSGKPARFVKAGAATVPTGLAPEPGSSTLTAVAALPAPSAAPAPAVPATLAPPTPEAQVVAGLPAERPAELPASSEKGFSEPAVASAAVAAAMFGEPGKAIRRIVIFYRDGSFADYQPEA